VRNLAINIKRGVGLAALLLLFIFFAACSRPVEESSLASKKQRLSSLLEAAGALTVPFRAKSSIFTLYGLHLQNMSCKGSDLHLYLEGDGLAWASRNRPSADPTPLHPLVARLYRSDVSKCKVYLARPCQYINDSACSVSDWTSDRYSSRVIQSYDEVLNQLKQQYGNSSFTLIGYSGGATVAALLAAHRDDIKQLVTVAGNLDIDAWTKYHKITPLYGSLNPINSVSALRQIPQEHLIGGRDKIVPRSVFESYYKRLTPSSYIRYKIYPSNTHTSGWESAWRSYQKRL
jgi:hypothetical protein